MSNTLRCICGIMIIVGSAIVMYVSVMAGLMAVAAEPCLTAVFTLTIPSLTCLVIQIVGFLIIKSAFTGRHN